MKSGTGHQSGHTSPGHVCSAHQRNFPDPALLCTPVPHVPPVFTASASTLLPSLQMHCSIVRLGPLTEPMEVPQNIPVPRVQAGTGPNWQIRLCYWGLHANHIACMQGMPSPAHHAPIHPHCCISLCHDGILHDLCAKGNLFCCHLLVS